MIKYGINEWHWITFIFVVGQMSSGNWILDDDDYYHSFCWRTLEQQTRQQQKISDPFGIRHCRINFRGIRTFARTHTQRPKTNDVLFVIFTKSCHCYIFWMVDAARHSLQPVYGRWMHERGMWIAEWNLSHVRMPMAAAAAATIRIRFTPFCILLLPRRQAFSFRTIVFSRDSYRNT